jgi:nicotinamidase-related amidase
VAGTDATRANVLNHRLPGSQGLQVMAELLDPTDVVVHGKKRYDAFASTELDAVLRSRGIETLLLLTGVNTNSCVLATTVAANARDYAPLVIEDCVRQHGPLGARAGAGHHQAGVRLDRNGG